MCKTQQYICMGGMQDLNMKLEDDSHRNAIQLRFQSKEPKHILTQCAASPSQTHTHKPLLNRVEEMARVPCLIESKQMAAGFHKGVLNIRC